MTVQAIHWPNAVGLCSYDFYANCIDIFTSIDYDFLSGLCSVKPFTFFLIQSQPLISCINWLMIHRFVYSVHFDLFFYLELYKQLLNKTRFVFVGCCRNDYKTLIKQNQNILKLGRHALALAQKSWYLICWKCCNKKTTCEYLTFHDSWLKSISKRSNNREKKRSCKYWPREIRYTDIQSI